MVMSSEMVTDLLWYNVFGHHDHTSAVAPPAQDLPLLVWRERNPLRVSPKVLPQGQRQGPCKFNYRSCWICAPETSDTWILKFSRYCNMTKANWHMIQLEEKNKTTYWSLRFIKLIWWHGIRNSNLLQYKEIYTVDLKYYFPTQLIITGATIIHWYFGSDWRFGQISKTIDVK